MLAMGGLQLASANLYIEVAIQRLSASFAAGALDMALHGDSWVCSAMEFRVGYL